MENKSLKGILLAIAGASLWGVSGNVGQFLLQNKELNVEWLITVRLLIAGTCLLLFAKTVEKAPINDIWKEKSSAIQLLVFSITGMLAVQYTYFAAVRYSNAATATVLQYTGPVMIVVYLALKKKAVPKLTELLEISLAVIGTFLLVTHGNVHTLSISVTALLLGIASAIALAIYTLQPAELLKKYNAATVTGWGMLCGGIAFCFVHAPWRVSGIWDFQTVIGFVYLMILGTIIPFYAYMTAVKIIGGQKSSLLATAEPLSATILAVLWLNTSFTAIDWIGSLCIITTVVLLTIRNKKVAL
ncbi:DMT family transporter [Chitinophaga sp. Cy-1792]|uniref:DMT family transporter n=1 Tax=Chitinophaga sp. Cy-1792 TaxID=2608339 RepID=UPI0014223A7B|nr:EamA family transporter [Chitinophaga sp. Cy-1792]NIG55689.1 EamA family transporter [Chitinophaga sp. Cy-1792]